jgi:hypothetical protein
MNKKEHCQKLYRELKSDFGDLDSAAFRGHWFSRAQQLKEAGCWWHYSVLKRKAKDYLAKKGDFFIDDQGINHKPYK